MSNLDKAIHRAIRSYVNEDKRQTKKVSLKEAIHNSLNNFINENWFGEEDDTKKNVYRKKKKSGGRSEVYDYTKELQNNPHVADSDANTIRNKIDDEYLNNAALARSVFPDHTPEGAQSQLRKILNGERPMTKKVANKINKKISGGEIPTT